MFEPKIKKNLLSKEECSRLILLLENSNYWDKNESDVPKTVSINTSYHKFGKDFGNFIKEKTLEIRKIIQQEYNLNSTVYPDTASICRWLPGMRQSPHTDDSIINGIKGYEHRVFGSIIYLNADYEGGHTYYPTQNFEIIPETGKVAIHRGDVEHLHGVTKITDGIRYTITSFWTYDKEKSIDWSIFE